MKHFLRIFLTLSFLIFTKYTFSQDPIPDIEDEMSQPGANFYDIQTKMQQYFDAHPDSTIEDDEQMEFERWKWFWNGRVDNASTGIKTGSFNYSSRALSSYMQSPICIGSGATPSNWIPIGPMSQPQNSSGTYTEQNMGIITNLYVDPLNNNNIFAGSNSGGLFKTMDGGISWVNPDISRLPAMGVNSIAVDPTSSNQTIYVATGMPKGVAAGYGIGIVKSTNGGTNWNQTSLTIDPSVGGLYVNNSTYKVEINKVTPTILYAIATNKVYRTEDGFVNPAPPFLTDITPNPSAIYQDVRLQPGNTNMVYATGNELWMSPNEGASGTWIQLDALPSFGTTPAGPAGFPIFVSRSNIEIHPISTIGVYAFVKYTYYDGSGTLASDYKTVAHIKFYDLLASTWTSSVQTNLFSVQPRINLTVNANNPSIIYCESTNRTVCKSIDGGLNFVDISNYNSFYSGTYTHADIRTITLFPVGTSGSDILFIGNDGGVLKSINGGANWTNINGSGLNITQFFGISSRESNSPAVFFVGGAQDNGLFTYNGNWLLQSVSTVGDAYRCAIDPNIANNMFACANGGSNYLMKSTTGGGFSWSSTPTQPPGYSMANRPILIDNASVWYAGYHDVFKSTTLATTPWTAISSFTSTFGVGANDKLAALSVAPSNSQFIYAAFEEPIWPATSTTPISNKFFMTPDGGTTWIDLTPTLDAVRYAGITSIAIDPNNPLRIWITFSNFWPNPAGIGANRVVYGQIASGTWVPSFSDYSTGLNEFPANTIVYKNGSNDGLYVGTDVGVFYRDATMSSWDCFNTGMPVGLVPDLKIDYCKGVIRASVYGRGVWESPLAPSSLAIPVTASVNSICPGQTTTLTTPTVTGSTFNWYDAATGGTLLFTGNSFTTPALSVTTTYYVEATNSYGCIGPRTAFTVTVKPAQDLYVTDSPDDIGSEPNIETAATLGVNFWSSSDVWIRQTNDGLINQFSEPIEYMASTPNYIYVRVKNRGCSSQSGELRVYWASAGTGLGWASDWVNNTTTYPGCTATIYGDEIIPSTSVTIPGLSEQIYQISWQPNNPDDYSCFIDPFHFCLLARIETTPVSPFGMTFPEGSDVWTNTKENNNIAWKNVIINNAVAGLVKPFGTSIVRNIDQSARFINLNFISKKDDIGQNLSEFKRIRLYFSKDFIKRWSEGGKRGKDVIIVNDSVVELTSSNATMEHIFLRYNEIGPVSLSLKTKKEPILSTDKYFNFDIVQYSEGSNTPQGGQTYQIKKGFSGENCLTSSSTLSGTITSSRVLSDSILVTGNILIPNGKTLRFEKATVMLAENVRIRVMPGGKLIINGSELLPACIGKKWIGIEVKGNPVFINPLTITNSFITGSDLPLNLEKSKGVLVSKSTLLGFDIGTSILMDKMKDFQISENTFSNFEIGIKTTNTSSADVKSGIEKNIFLHVKTAIDFTNDNHIKLDIKCNRFSYIDYAILSDQTILKDQGVLGEGAGNEFISNSTQMNSKLKHTNGNSPKYYYNPSQPITSGMNITTLASSTDRTCYVYSFDTTSTVPSHMMTPLNIQDAITKKIMEVYAVPNPSTGRASIYFSLGEEKQGELMIMDIYGKIIDRKKVTNESNKVDVDYSEYANGIYMISLTNPKGEIMNKKMIIAK